MANLEQQKKLYWVVPLSDNVELGVRAAMQYSSTWAQRKVQDAAGGQTRLLHTSARLLPGPLWAAIRC